MTRGAQALHTSLLTLAAYVLISACAVGPDYKRPNAEMPQQCKEAGDWKTADPNDVVTHSKWWEIFNDPQLNTLEKQVVTTNQNVLIAKAQYHQAQALMQSVQASFLLALDVNVSATRSRSVHVSVNLDGGLSTGNPNLLNSQNLSFNTS